MNESEHDLKRLFHSAAQAPQELPIEPSHALEQRIIDRFDRQMSVFVTSAHLLDDGVIDPRDTRAVLAQVLTVCREADARQPQAMQFSVARP